MNNEPLISVIIPIYNTAHYLNACIESVLNQTYKNIEIILVDDESPDEAPQMCDEWETKEERVKVIHKKNEGLGLARNAGLEIANGEYVCFFDSDDTLDADTFEGCIEALEVKGADACFYGRKTQKADGSFSVNTHIPTKLIYEGDEVKKEFSTTYLGPMPNEVGPGYIQASACCGMYRRSVIEDAGIRFLSEREYLSEDTFFNLEICKCARKIIIIPKDYYNYTYNKESLTKRYNPRRFEQLKNFYKQLLEIKKDFADANDVENRVPYQLYIYLRHIVEYEVKSIKNNGLRRTYKRIKDICSDPFIRENITTINTNILNKKRKVFVRWIERKNVWGIIVFYLIK